MKTFNKVYLKSIILFALIIFLSVYINGCEPSGSYVEVQNFEVSALDYSDYHFFPDTLYKTSFVDFMNNISGNYLQSTIDNQILNNDSTFEIWLQTETVNPYGRYASATTMLYEEPPGGYNDTLINTTQVPGLHYFGYFRKLESWEYYIYPIAGMIGININVPTDYHAAISYKTNDSKKYGTSSFESNSSDTLILKMFKTDTQEPGVTPLAWELKLKNVYRLPINNIFNDGFELNVYYDSAGAFIKTIPNGLGIQRGLLGITKLDRYTGTTHNPPPDSVFDFLVGYTIDTSSSDIIFPYLRPFLDDFILANINSNYHFAELYTQSKTIASTAPNANKYFLKGFLKKSWYSQ